MGSPPRPGRQRPATVLADQAEVARLVDGLAAQLSARHPEGVVLIGILKSSLLFLADLARALTVPVRIELLWLSSFQPVGPPVEVHGALSAPIEGQAVVIVETLVDTGLTLAVVRQELVALGASRVTVCALVDKPARRLLPVAADLVGFTAPDRFLVGYGLDFAGRYRNLPFIAGADSADLAAEPDCHVAQLYELMGTAGELRDRSR